MSVLRPAGLGLLAALPLFLTPLFLMPQSEKSAGPAPGPDSTGFDYSNYAAALNGYVDDQGMVDYKGLKADRGGLDLFVEQLASLAREEFDTWSEKDKLAFWINAYNGLTLRAIIDHYPIKSSLLGWLTHPKNSIRQIPGVWDKLEFRVMGSPITLDEIEHSVLRVQFREPRIHMALVCAARGCPQLRSEPYLGQRIEEQLAGQTMRFLLDPHKFSIDRGKKKVKLSPIFDWFAEDFLGPYLESGPVKGFKPAERAVLNFISGYLEYRDGLFIHSSDYKISYLKYDWSLNERQVNR